MVQQVGHGVAVHHILAGRVAHHVKPALARVFSSQLPLRLRHGSGLQLADQIFARLAQPVKLQGELGALGFQRPARRRHAHPAQLNLGLVFQSADHPAGYLGYLLNFHNLPVQHGPPAVLLLLDGAYMEAALFRPAQHADDAPGPDVQSEYNAWILLCSDLWQGDHLVPFSWILPEDRLFPVPPKAGRPR